MFCPNSECPDRIADSRPGEYRQEIEICPICGATLVATLAEVDGFDEPNGTADARTAVPDGAPDRVVLRTSNLVEADMASSMLEEHDVPFYRRTLALGGIGFGTGTAALAPGGEHILLVPEGAADRAEHLLEGLFAEFAGPEETTDPPEASSSTGAFVRVVLVAMLLLSLGLVLRSLL